MENGIELEGMKEFTAMLENMTIDEADEKKAVRKAIKPIAEEIKKNTPVGEKGKLKKLSVTVKKEDLATVGTVRTTAFYDIFQEFGTSKQKKNVGYFDRSVKAKEDEAIGILSDELLNKAK